MANLRLAALAAFTAAALAPAGAAAFTRAEIREEVRIWVEVPCQEVPVWKSGGEVTERLRARLRASDGYGVYDSIAGDVLAQPDRYANRGARLAFYYSLTRGCYE